MGVGRLSAVAGLLLLIVGPLVYWQTRDDGPPTMPQTVPSAAPAPPPVIKVDLFVVGPKARRFAADGPIQPDEKLRLRVALDRPAHLLVGRRRAGKAELVYPRGMAGRSVAMPKRNPREIGQPFAAQAGDEVVLYACASTFTWPTVRDLGEHAGCARWTQVVQ